MTTQDLLVAGGGIAGLAVALAAGNRHTRVLEQASTFQEVGAGLQIGPNAVRALQALGAWDAVAAIVTSPPEIHMWDGVSGKRLKRLRLGQTFENRFGAPYRLAHRANLHDALLQVVLARPSITVEMNAAVIHAAQHEGGVTATLASGRSVGGAALIAADGVKSVLRQQLFPGSAPADSGDTLNRALLDDVPAVAGVAMDCVNLWMLPGGHVVHYPIGKLPRLNIVAVTPRGRDVRSFFERACEPLRAVLRGAFAWLPWPGLYARPLPHWHSGRLLLAGDAAHATLPYLAQGGAMALEDAACLQQQLHGNTAIEQAFASVSSQRVARATHLLQESLRAGTTYHASGVMRLARNATITALPESALLTRLDWIYAHGQRPPGGR